VARLSFPHSFPLSSGEGIAGGRFAGKHSGKDLIDVPQLAFQIEGALDLAF
jgi:hypothetical protein